MHPLYSAHRLRSRLRSRREARAAAGYQSDAVSVRQLVLRLRWQRWCWWLSIYQCAQRRPLPPAVATCEGCCAPEPFVLILMLKRKSGWADLRCVDSATANTASQWHCDVGERGVVHISNGARLGPWRNPVLLHHRVVSAIGRNCERHRSWRDARSVIRSP